MFEKSQFGATENVGATGISPTQKSNKIIEYKRKLVRIVTKH
jgi:hypothetical protein